MYSLEPIEHLHMMSKQLGNHHSTKMAAVFMACQRPRDHFGVILIEKIIKGFQGSEGSGSGQPLRLKGGREEESSTLRKTAYFVSILLNPREASQVSYIFGEKGPLGPKIT